MVSTGAVLGCGASPQTPSTEKAAPPQPKAAENATNVVFILTDDQDTALMKYMPNVRRLIADKGTTFENSFVSNALCCPSRATSLTGQYSHNHGVVTNKDGLAEFDETNTVPVWLREAGYSTAFIGKYLNGFPGPDGDGDAPPGWDEFVALSRHVTDLYHYTLITNGHERKYGSGERKYKTNVLGEYALTSLEERVERSRPFFLTYAPTAPHAELSEEGCGDPRPAPGTPELPGRVKAPRTKSFDEADVSDKPGYVQAFPRIAADRLAELDCQFRSRASSLVAVDGYVKKIIELLEASDQLDSTLIIFASDNGYVLGQHRIPAGKVIPYEESIRVPFIVRGPGVPEGAVRKQLIVNPDWAATIADAANATPGIEGDGISVLPLAADASRGLDREILLEAEESQPIPGNVAPAYSGIRTPNWKYIEYETGERELYDMNSDRYELVNLADDKSFAKERAVLEKRLKVLRQCAGESCR